MGQNYLFLLLAAGVGFALLFMILRKPYLGLAFIIASLPLLYLTILPKGFNFTSLTGILGGMTLVSYLFHRRGNRNTLYKRKPRYTTDKLLYFVIILLMAEVLLWDLMAPVQLDRFFIITYVQLIFLVWLAERTLETQSQLETLMKIFIMVNLAALVVSLMNFDFFVENPEANRLEGMVGNANEFSMYVGVSVLFLMYFFEKAGNRISKVAILSLGLIMFVPVLLSGSRGGFLFLVITLAYQYWRFQRSSLIIIGVLFMLALLNSSFLAGGYIERMLDIPADLLSQSDTIGLRIHLWQYAIELWKTSPIFGIGTGVYVLRSIDSPVLHGIKMLQAHNTYVTYLAENGAVGLFLFLIAVIKSTLNYENAIRFFHKINPEMKKLAITWQGVLLLFALNGLKGNLNTGKLFWFSFGISLLFNHFVFSATQPALEKEDGYAKTALRTDFAKFRQ